MPQPQSLSTPPRDLACLKADALYKLWNAPKHAETCIVVTTAARFHPVKCNTFHSNVSSVTPKCADDLNKGREVHNSVQNCCLLPRVVHPQFCTELLSSTAHPSTIMRRIVFFYSMSIHISADNCHFQPLRPLHNCRQ
jgi:hypothetical protein